MGFEVKYVGGADPFSYGVLRIIGNQNAPTLFYLGGSIQDMLLDPVHSELAYTLINATPSWNILSVDLPCFGDWQFTGISSGLTGWRELADNNVDFMALLTARIQAALDSAVALGITDPSKVAVAGISRGGFAALHCVQAGVIPHASAICPVTKLTALSEFSGFVGSEPMPLSPSILSANGFHLSISDADTRVSTAIAAQFCADTIALTASVYNKVEMHITKPSLADTHSQIVGEPLESAQWLLRRLGLPAL